MKFKTIWVCLMVVYFISCYKDTLVPIIGLWMTVIPLVTLYVIKQINKEENNNE